MSRFSVDKHPDDVLNDIAQKHKKLRKQFKLTQNELATRTGISLGSIKRFEQTGEISLHSLLRLAHFFDRLADFDNVFYIDEQMERVRKLFSK
jgi:transcriptional regulator with XRE-family HTH domain